MFAFLHLIVSRYYYYLPEKRETLRFYFHTQLGDLRPLQVTLFPISRRSYDLFPTLTAR